MALTPFDDEIEELVEEAPPRVIDREWDPLEWQDRAACRYEDPDLFFGPPGERPETRRAREAYAIDAFCSTCTVGADCRDFARRHREYGLWFETEHDRVAAGFAPDMPIGVSARLATMVRRGLIVR